MPLLVLPGSSALSAFRAERLAADINRAIDHASVAVSAYYIHLVRSSAQLPIADRDVLDRLLAYGSKEANSPSPADRSFLDALVADGCLPASASSTSLVLVLPRPGTISPWSSKATDIAHTCGLSQVRRIERGIAYFISTGSHAPLTPAQIAAISPLLLDRMTQVAFAKIPSDVELFGADASTAAVVPRPLKAVELSAAKGEAKDLLVKANKQWGLALADDEIDYLVSAFMTGTDSHDPSDAELMMFSQVNSEHCRHKIFRASWTIDGTDKPHSLFDMIRNTYKLHPDHILSAYSDNAAVLTGPLSTRFAYNPRVEGPGAPAHQALYHLTSEEVHTLAKVETHNHPTAVSPFPGASTGSGGEIRDEGAVGQGSKPRVGLTGFTVSNLRIPGFTQPWESVDYGKPAHISSALDIMIQAPLGGAAFNNEFGRASICGYFRTFLQSVPTSDSTSELRGYHKPIMIAGGTGSVRPMHIMKKPIPPGALLIVLGGPSMLIGLGGGAASSMTSGSSSADLDFASVQRDNPEMQRRAQMVLDSCTALGDATPLLAVHDVGAGGLSNALPELVHDSDRGAVFEIRDVACDDPLLSPMEIWCNESQERYVMAILPKDLPLFEGICRRERCPFAVVGVATEEQRLIVKDRLFGKDVINLSMHTLFGKPPKMHRVADTLAPPRRPVVVPTDTPLDAIVDRVLRLPSVASKSFLITIGDRTVTGLIARDQMVGPWQVPVADVSVSLTGYTDVTGEAMSMGERTPVALISAAASARMAVAESLTNLVAADVANIATVRLSANWMAAADHPGEGSNLYEAVAAVGLDLCPKLGVTIPVGKDSMSMKARWTSDDGQARSVVAPLSLIVTAYGPVADSTVTWTPELRGDDAAGPTVLMLLDLGLGKTRLGGSAVAQVFDQLGNEAPDVESADVLKSFWKGLAELRAAGKARKAPVVLAYHDRSDGGLFTTVAEMCFAGRCGVEVDVAGLPAGTTDPVACLFNEELGAVIQVTAADVPLVRSTLAAAGFPEAQHAHVLGAVTGRTPGAPVSVRITRAGAALFEASRADLQAKWAETSYRMQQLRDNPACADAEFAAIRDEHDTGVAAVLTFDPREGLPAAIPPTVEQLAGAFAHRPRVAVIREQGVNSHAEMAWAFHAAGFAAVDVHMTDLISGRVSLADDPRLVGAAFPGGFSYGDVLGAGAGWAKSALLNPAARANLAAFFARKDTFAIGICNGCQMLASLRDIVPGAAAWPRFVRNRSEQFEARVAVVEVPKEAESASPVFFAGMAGSRIPIAVAHGEGRAQFDDDQPAAEGLIALRYVDSTGRVAGPERYPYNPNGSELGAAGVVSADGGRVLALMPHPERIVRVAANTWALPDARRVAGPDTDADGYGGWIRIFTNARAWVERNRA
ncbi:CobB/CobQ-like glutamine amidotransferase domain-containing protein [Zopfochytrium polystomum]|nr:CobB/CobQ-like glutamine amidotransferase domain-containing protein [Zopfochytrium polystomum]